MSSLSNSTSDIDELICASTLILAFIHSKVPFLFSFCFLIFLTYLSLFSSSKMMALTTTDSHSFNTNSDLEINGSDGFTS